MTFLDELKKEVKKSGGYESLWNLEDVKGLIQKQFFHIPYGGPEFTPKQYGERIRELRIGMGMTLDEVAIHLDTNKQTISNIENGKSKEININRMLDFVCLFQCTAAYLLGHTDNPQEVEAGAGKVPFEFFDENTRVTVKRIAEGYRKDKKLCELLIDLLRGTKTERAFYRRAIEAMLSYPGRSSK